MPTKWQEKKAKQAEYNFEKQLQTSCDDTTKINIINDVAMGGGDVQVFERKLTKDEKKAIAKAKRDAKKSNTNDTNDTNEETAANDGMEQLSLEAMTLQQTNANTNDDGIDYVLSEKLANEYGTICTYASQKRSIDFHRSRDINIQNVTIQHMGNILLDETEIRLNHGNRYGLIARNGAGKSTLLRAIGHRAVPIPNTIDIFFLDQEVSPSSSITALQAVMSVDEVRTKLEKNADDLNHYVAVLADKISNNETPPSSDNTGGATVVKSYEEQQEDVMDVLNSIYERLDLLDADTAEVRARSILAGLGFTHEMQSKYTIDFSGGWRMRVSLARALFLQPTCLLLDEPTNHLDMEAVVWLEDYLSKWNRILLLVSHSQDFLNNVCSHIIHITPKYKKLIYYDGNYDSFIKTKTEKDDNQSKQYKWEQEQIKHMKEYIARFGHGTAKNAKQAQSKEKVLAKMIRAGLTEKPEEEKILNFKFTNPGHLPPPVLAFNNVSFAYPNCISLYTNVNFGIDLDSRIALVGPNGAGKTTLVKLMTGELRPSMGDIRPHGHLKLGRFTQHFVDVLDLELTPLEFFDKLYPTDAREDQRKYLGRFGISGRMQVQKMNELSDGQKSRVVFAKLGRDVPHILLLDEPTNHLDMESIDALAKAINEFEGGLVLVSHDMRLISQVAKEIWMCDNKTITPYKGNIDSFKMNMRAQMGIGNNTTSSNSNATNAAGPIKLKGDASVKQKILPESMDETTKTTTKSSTLSKKKTESTKTTTPPQSNIDDDNTTIATSTTTTTSSSSSTSTTTAGGSSVTTSNTTNNSNATMPVKGRYIPPHLRKKMLEEQMQQQQQESA